MFIDPENGHREGKTAYLYLRDGDGQMNTFIDGNEDNLGFEDEIGQAIEASYDRSGCSLRPMQEHRHTDFGKLG